MLHLVWYQLSWPRWFSSQDIFHRPICHWYARMPNIHGRDLIRLFEEYGYEAVGLPFTDWPGVWGISWN